MVSRRARRTLYGVKNDSVRVQPAWHRDGFLSAAAHGPDPGKLEYSGFNELSRSGACSTSIWDPTDYSPFGEIKGQGDTTTHLQMSLGCTSILVPNHRSTEISRYFISESSRMYIPDAFLSHVQCESPYMVEDPLQSQLRRQCVRPPV